jgi:adenosine deaminase CECR1
MAEPISSTDDAAWEKEEGIPSLTDPFIQKYLEGRDALVAQEKKQRSGW